MLATISKWGNSRALRIPKQLALDLGLDFGSKVELVLDEGQLRIVPVNEPHYTLEELVAQITPENRHGEIDIGPAVGKEVWW
ncbi:MAG: AbrB/MazE/SpoVT family DNA-binding domain-containing protein [Chloroflexota bacterium]|nr:AbrB/MazE/SpoVT family DNA-binding domain-containing protein [Chloroflexota bacterium]